MAQGSPAQYEARYVPRTNPNNLGPNSDLGPDLVPVTADLTPGLMPLGVMNNLPNTTLTVLQRPRSIE
jgi:hypothetical protein